MPLLKLALPVVLLATLPRQWCPQSGYFNVSPTLRQPGCLGDPQLSPTPPPPKPTRQVRAPAKTSPAKPQPFIHLKPSIVEGHARQPRLPWQGFDADAQLSVIQELTAPPQAP